MRLWKKNQPINVQEQAINEINVSLAVMASALKQVALDVDILRKDINELREEISSMGQTKPNWFIREVG